MREELLVSSPAFVDMERMPDEYTGFGEDVSPELRLENVCAETESMVVIMDDLDIPVRGILNHWVIWNISRTEVIPRAIPAGENVVLSEKEKAKSLRSAVQGVAYGKHRYRGPKIPFFLKNMHRYVFRVYCLDAYLELPASARKRDVEKAMEGHILQSGSLTGTYQL